MEPLELRAYPTPQSQIRRQGPEFSVNIPVNHDMIHFDSFAELELNGHETTVAAGIRS